MQLQNGRPTDTTGRLDKEIRTYDFLDKLGIEYQRIDHEAAFTMEVCEEIDKTLGATICKNLFLCNRQKTDFYLLMIPGDKTFKTKELSHQIGSARLSFASSEDMEKYLDKREYNEALVQELVEYIEVYADGSIHVCFKCKDEFQQIAEEMEGVQIG